MNPTAPINLRLHSLDFFRGVVMFLLIAEFFHLFGTLMNTGNPVITAISDFHFHHTNWEGLHFWDLIQPFFMFIVGVSIPFSYANRLKRGDSEKQIRNHAFRRSFLLLLMGWALYCIGPEKIIFQFDNVLAQLSLTYLVAFLLIKKTLVFTVVGVTPLFIYLFATEGGAELFMKIIKPYTNSLIGGFSPWLASYILGFIVLFCLWYVCHWLFQKRIFIKI